MAKVSWSFPTSPRNPAKIPVELALLAPLIASWRQEGKAWVPQTTQIEFGRALRDSGNIDGGEPDNEQTLAFKKQAEIISDANLAWTARARFGTYKFLGFVTINQDGVADLTNAGRRIIGTRRPDIVMLKQLIKWQYPDNQHKGNQYPHDIFAIRPFIAVTNLIKSMGGLTKDELSLFCFTMTTMKDIPRARKEIADFRLAYARATGKIAKRKMTAITRHSMRAQAQVQGLQLPVRSFQDYADSLARYMRYTGLFSISGTRLIITRGREEEVDELIELPLHIEPYNDRSVFYQYYGNPDIPTLSTDVNPSILQRQAEALNKDIINLHADFGLLERGIPLESSFQFPEPLPNDIEELRQLLDILRELKKNIELKIITIRGRGPDRLREAIAFYDAILGHRTFDAATYLEWNTWRVFLALDNARLIKPNLILDENLEPVNTALGGGPDMEVSFDDFHVVPEVTMRRGTDQSYYETYPVERHVREFMQRVGNQETYGLFIAPSCHLDTVHQFFIYWKYGGRSGQIIKIVPITIKQFSEITGCYIERQGFQPHELLLLFRHIEAALLESQNSDEWHGRIPIVIEHWKQDIQHLGEENNTDSSE